MECNFDGNTDRLFCLGAYYFFKSSRKRSKIKELTFEDNVVEQDRLACMWEEGLTDPLAEQTRHKALTEIIGQEKAIRALRAALCGPNPQHVLIYGPPGVGKTAAARLILEEAKAREESPFRQKAKFVEIDATALQFDERNIADPLLGSVHDPIYQGGAGAFWQVGIPQPRPGAAMFLALYSAYTETPVPNTLALTGEIGLHGQILPVGGVEDKGVEDKLEAAQQAGATLALIPQENWREVYREIEVVPVGACGKTPSKTGQRAAFRHHSQDTRRNIEDMGSLGA